MALPVVRRTRIPELPLVSRGKVRDIYGLDNDRLLIVTTDRISAFDVVMDDPIPQKGVVLNQITLFWMRMMADLVPNHLLADDIQDFPAGLAAHAGILRGRSVVARRANPLPVECIVRGYITGSGWSDYLKTGAVCGYTLPKNLRQSERLAQPLFTPSTKAELGRHDENITLDQAAGLLGRDLMRRTQELSLAIYSRARDYADSRGIIIADTKFEFGLINNELVLIDEVLTPDSSRFWPKDAYAPGRSQPSFDKQYLRDWLVGVGFDKKPPAPAIPAEIVSRTQEKYLDAYRMLTGSDLAVSHRFRPEL